MTDGISAYAGEFGGFKVEVYSLDRSHIAKAIPLNKPTMYTKVL